MCMSGRASRSGGRPATVSLAGGHLQLNLWRMAIQHLYDDEEAVSLAGGLPATISLARST